MTLYSIRTTLGQEKTTSQILKSKINKEKMNIHSIIVVDRLRGYIFIESDDKEEVESLARGVKHARGVIKGEMGIEEIKPFIEEETLTSEIERGDTVELTSGAFKGEKAKVKRIDQAKEKITVEIIEAEVPIPITVDASDVRLLTTKENS